MAAPDCDCHREPMYWQKDNRLRAGGRWICAVKHRAWHRDHYSRNHVARINKRLAQDARVRREVLAARRAAVGPANPLLAQALVSIKRGG